MSKLDELTNELCPNGAEHMGLRTIAYYSNTRVSASVLDESNFVGVDNLLPNKAGKINAQYLPNTARLTSYFPGDVLLGNIRPYLHKIWLADKPGGCSGDVLAIRIAESYRPYILPEFLYYVLSSDSFFAFDMKHAKGAKMPRGNKDAIMNFVVPVPPLPVQQEIVRILDMFTQLEAELEAELEARRKQYDHYRRELLDFSNNSSVEWSTLGEVSMRVSSGGTPSSQNPSYYGGDIPWLRTQEVDFNEIKSTGMTITEKGLKNSSAKWIPANSVIVAMYGATAAKTAINAIPLTTNQACCNLQIDPSKAEFRYVFHWISNCYHQLRSLGEGSQNNINSRKVKSFRIPLPTLEVQRSIVTVLDNFDSLVHDLSSGLPAEISARRKQYEYYRDKLLTFKELSA